MFQDSKKGLGQLKRFPCECQFCPTTVGLMCFYIFAFGFEFRSVMCLEGHLIEFGIGCLKIPRRVADNSRKSVPREWD